MRVCFVIYGSIEQVTGGYNYDRRVLTGLRAQGDEVNLVSIEQNAEIRPREVLRAVFASNPDVVVGDELCHSELAWLFRAVRAVSYRSKGRPRCVLLVHHLAEWENGVVIASERRALRLADSIVVTSSDSAARLRSGFGIKSVVCIPGANHLPQLSRIAAEGDALRLLYVGTWTERKGLLRLVEALRDCPELGYELTIVGDAHRDEAYRRRVLNCIESSQLKQRCTDLGVVSDQQLAEVYARNDVLVLPSEYEGYGMVLAEAAAAGLRVLCSAAGGTSEAVQHAAGVEWTQPGDSAGLTRALTDVIRSRTRSPELFEHTPALSGTFPTWEQCVARFRSVLAEAQNQ